MGLYCLSPGALNFFLLVEMFELDRRTGRGHLYFGVDIILVKHLVNQQWVQTGWLVPSWAELTTIFPSMTVLFVFGQKWERPERRSSPSSGTMKLKELQYKRTFTIGPNTCQLATVTVDRPSRVNVQETNNSQSLSLILLIIQSLIGWPCYVIVHVCLQLFTVHLVYPIVQKGVKSDQTIHMLSSGFNSLVHTGPLNLMLAKSDHKNVIR